jgi:hypothetical protein
VSEQSRPLAAAGSGSDDAMLSDSDVYDLMLLVADKGEKGGRNLALDAVRLVAWHFQQVGQVPARKTSDGASSRRLGRRW